MALHLPQKHNAILRRILRNEANRRHATTMFRARERFIQDLRYEDGYYGFEPQELRKFIEAGLMDGIRQIMREPLPADQLGGFTKLSRNEVAVIAKLPSWIKTGTNVHAPIVHLRYANEAQLAKAIALRTQQRAQLYDVERNMERLRGMLGNRHIRCLNDLLPRSVSNSRRKVKPRVNGSSRKLPVKRRVKVAARKRKVSA